MIKYFDCDVTNSKTLGPTAKTYIQVTTCNESIGGINQP